MYRRAKGKYLIFGVALGLALVWGNNRRSLPEGLTYLRQKLAWNPDNARPIDPASELGVCYELASLNNAGRYEVIIRRLHDLNLVPIFIPIPGGPLPNIGVLFGDSGPYTLFVAHYDKSRETPTYQGASDNTAAVGVLLAAIRDLVAAPPARPVGFLFTSAEEQGLKGAKSFIDWAQTQALAIDQVINFDMLGRGKLASRPSALPGFYFWLPGLGQMVYDGRHIRRGRPYPLPDSQLMARLKELLGDDLVIYQQFTARSDSNIFQAAGWPTVSLSSDNIYYLDLVWEREADRLELLDEDNLTLARRFVVDYARLVP
jgi:hypothetical protein